MSSDESIRVLAAVLERAGRYLICQRPAHKRHGGLWEFPGGKLEAGEELREAAERELMEELGVEARSVGPLVYAVRDPASPYVIEFATVEIAGEPAAHEHAALRWVTPAEALDLPLAPADAAFVRDWLQRRAPAAQSLHPASPRNPEEEEAEHESARTQEG